MTMLLGIILIVCGILIAAYPPLLSLIVATLFISAGIITLIAGYRYKKMAKKFEDPFIDFFMRT
jgi:Flp pilus assembly protein TadB